MEYEPLGLGILIGGLLAGIATFAYFSRKTTGGDSEIEVVRLKTQLEEQQKHATEMQQRMNETFAKISQEAIEKKLDRFFTNCKVAICSV